MLFISSVFMKRVQPSVSARSTQVKHNTLPPKNIATKPLNIQQKMEQYAATHSLKEIRQNQEKAQDAFDEKLKLLLQKYPFLQMVEDKEKRAVLNASVLHKDEAYPVIDYVGLYANSTEEEIQDYILKEKLTDGNIKHLRKEIQDAKYLQQKHGEFREKQEALYSSLQQELEKVDYQELKADLAAWRATFEPAIVTSGAEILHAKYDPPSKFDDEGYAHRLFTKSIALDKNSSKVLAEWNNPFLRQDLSKNSPYGADSSYTIIDQDQYSEFFKNRAGENQTVGLDFRTTKQQQTIRIMKKLLEQTYDRPADLKINEYQNAEYALPMHQLLSNYDYGSTITSLQPVRAQSATRRSYPNYISSEDREQGDFLTKFNVQSTDVVTYRKTASRKPVRKSARWEIKTQPFLTVSRTFVDDDNSINSEKEWRELCNSLPDMVDSIVYGAKELDVPITFIKQYPDGHKVEATLVSVADVRRLSVDQIKKAFQNSWPKVEAKINPPLLGQENEQENAKAQSAPKQDVQPSDKLTPRSAIRTESPGDSNKNIDSNRIMPASAAKRHLSPSQQSINNQPPVKKAKSEQNMQKHIQKIQKDIPPQIVSGQNQAHPSLQYYHKSKNIKKSAVFNREP